MNAVYYNTIQALPEAEREEFVSQKRAEFQAEIDIWLLASEMVVDAVVEGSELREELIGRFAVAQTKHDRWPCRRAPVAPV